MYVGNFSSNSPGEKEIADSLEELGHEVDRLDENYITDQDIKERLKMKRYDFFLFAKLRVRGNVRQLLETIEIPKIMWVFDLYWGLYDET